MKLLLLVLAILVFAITAHAQKIVTCEVVEPDKSVACPESGKMVLFTFEGLVEAKQIFDEWRLVAPLQNESVNTDAPLSSRTISAGDKVKAIVTEQRFAPVAACEVRVWRNIKLWRRFKEGERVPNTLFTLPDDCQPGYEKE